MSTNIQVMVISGARKGIGRFLAEHYLAAGWRVFGCSRSATDLTHPAYHSLLTPAATVGQVLATNVTGTFLFCREGAKLMRNSGGRIVNFATVATPLRLEGEAIYAASKAAVVSLTQILAHEFGGYGITVNAVGPTPVKTDLTHAVPPAKMDALIARQAIKRWGEFSDVAQVVDFYLHPGSSFVTGQVIYLGGVS